MPDFVAVNNSIEVRIGGYHVTKGKKLYNIIHCDCGSPLPTLAEVTAAVGAVSNWVINSYKSLFVDDILVNEVRGRSNAQEPGPTYTNSTINQIGALTGDMVPMSQAMCINLLTNLTGRSQRGKFYVFPTDEVVQVNGLYTGAYAAACELSIVALQGELSTAGFALAIESRRHLALYQVQSVLAQNIPAHLSSRKENRGI